MSSHEVSQSTKDLTTARAKTSFSVDAVNKLLNEGSRDSAMRARIAGLVSNDPGFSKANVPYLSRAQRLERGLALTKKLFEFVDEHDLDYMEYLEALFTMDDSVGVYLHEVAFQPVISSQGSDEQQAIWVPKCLNHEILGCYLQTELAHGSNVQQLETTATYVPESQEFELHSPTIGSTKWWIGGLGLMATHGVVQAQLVLNGKRIGPHTFIVQLRSLEDHSLMPGISAGEIGPKVHGAMAGLDNGWARFDRVRIPRNQMLSRFAKVSKEGQYSKPPHDKLSYGGMIFIRAQMIGNLAWQLAKASTISTRYLHIRRQFADGEAKPGDPNFGIENQVINYPAVYMRILPQIARAYVFITIGKDMSTLYERMSSQLANSGDVSLLAETHAVAAGLKSYVSAATVEGAEICRRAMGGHGFMDAAGIGRIFATNLPATTYEGDNYILNLQVCRAALKTLASIRKDPKTQLTPSSAYFSVLTSGDTVGSLRADTGNAWRSHELILKVFSLRAAAHVVRLERLLKTGRKFGDLSHDCVGASRAIVEAYLARRMIAALEDKEEGMLYAGVTDAERVVLQDLVHFYLLYTIEQSLPDLLEFGVLSSVPQSASLEALQKSPVETLRIEIDQLARRAVLPQSIGLTDAFKFSDYDLDSALGRYDGRAYETLLERAQRDLDVNAGGEAERKALYTKYIRPILERGARLSRM